MQNKIASYKGKNGVWNKKKAVQNGSKIFSGSSLSFQRMKCKHFCQEMPKNETTMHKENVTSTGKKPFQKNAKKTHPSRKECKMAENAKEKKCICLFIHPLMAWRNGKIPKRVHAVYVSRDSVCKIQRSKVKKKNDTRRKYLAAGIFLFPFLGKCVSTWTKKNERSRWIFFRHLLPPRAESTNSATLRQQRFRL